MEHDSRTEVGGAVNGLRKERPAARQAKHRELQADLIEAVFRLQYERARRPGAEEELDKLPEPLRHVAGDLEAGTLMAAKRLAAQRSLTNAAGIPAVVLTCGCKNAHSTTEHVAFAGIRLNALRCLGLIQVTAQSSH
jgi:hypothetical protein